MSGIDTSPIGRKGRKPLQTVQSNRFELEPTDSALRHWRRQDHRGGVISISGRLGLACGLQPQLLTLLGAVKLHVLAFASGPATGSEPLLHSAESPFPQMLSSGRPEADHAPARCLPLGRGQRAPRPNSEASAPRTSALQSDLGSRPQLRKQPGPLPSAPPRSPVAPPETAGGVHRRPQAIWWPSPALRPTNAEHRATVPGLRASCPTIRAPLHHTWDSSNGYRSRWLPPVPSQLLSTYRFGRYPPACGIPTSPRPASVSPRPTGRQRLAPARMPAVPALAECMPPHSPVSP
jgi:hypothetical protein